MVVTLNSKILYLLHGALSLYDILKIVSLDLLSIHVSKILVGVNCKKGALDKAINLAMLKSSLDILQYLWFIYHVNVHQVIPLLVVLLFKRVALVNALSLALNHFTLLIFATYHVLTDRGYDCLLTKCRNTLVKLLFLWTQTG